MTETLEEHVSGDVVDPEEAFLPALPALPQSVRDTLQAQLAKAQRRRTLDREIPGWEGTLHVVFRPLGDFEEIAEVLNPTGKAQRMTPSRATIKASREALILASTDADGAYALIDGTRTDIGLALGVDLYDALFPPTPEETARPRTDGEALTLLFPLGSMSIVTLAQELLLWSQGAADETGDEQVGESSAARTSRRDTPSSPPS